jgi:hypothetical protein
MCGRREPRVVFLDAHVETKPDAGEYRTRTVVVPGVAVATRGDRARGLRHKLPLVVAATGDGCALATQRWKAASVVRGGVRALQLVLSPPHPNARTLLPASKHRRGRSTENEKRREKTSARNEHSRSAECVRGHAVRNMPSLTNRQMHRYARASMYGVKTSPSVSLTPTNGRAISPIT